jgi:GNAT superfamily N-acetyltransferase
MASTESGSAASGSHIRPLVEADLPDCLALSRSAQWNQNAADWRMMLALGHGWGIEAGSARAGDGVAAASSLAAANGVAPASGLAAANGIAAGSGLAASILVIPYRAGVPFTEAAATGAGCAWISMVLVLPSFRRQGLATRLLRQALAFLAAENVVPVLDATPAGYPVYLREGFTPQWGFRRYRRVAACLDPGAAPPRSRPVEAADWPAIMALDAPVFGVDREPVLRALAARLPHAARVVERDGRVAGFVFGRDGLDACQIGPLLAEDIGTAQQLLDDVLNSVSGPVLLDLADSYLALLEGLVARGFVLQRPFTRMAKGSSPPGDPSRVVLVAGPELG